MASVSVQLGVLAIAKDPPRADLAPLQTVVDRAVSAGHKMIARQIVFDSEHAIRTQLSTWIKDPEIDVVIVLGGESLVVSKALAPLVSENLPGFTDLFRMLTFQEIGASAMLTSAEAAKCGTTFVFVVPGAIAAAMDQLILPQFDPATTPRNLIEQMPRLQPAVPVEIAPEKTRGGSGMPARLPAVPARDRPRTGANVISRSAKTTNDPATKPIDVAKLERQLADSARPDTDVTKTDLAKLPRLPPGANDQTVDDDLLDDDDVGDVTTTDTLAVQPAPPLPPAGPVTIQPRKKRTDENAAQPRAKPPTTTTPKPAIPSIAKPAIPSIAKPAALPTIAKPAALPTIAKPVDPPAPLGRGAAFSTPPGGAPAPRATPAPFTRPSVPPPIGARESEPVVSSTTRPPPVAARDSEPVVSSATRPPAAATRDSEPVVTSAARPAVVYATPIGGAPAPNPPPELAKPEAPAEIAKSEAPAEIAKPELVAPAPAEAAPAEATPSPPPESAPIASSTPTASVLPVSAPVAARVRQPTPPPPLPIAARAARPATVPPPLKATDNDLPRGAFQYPVKPRRKNLVLTVIAALGVTALAFVGVVYFLDKGEAPAASTDTVAAVTPPATPPPAPPTTPPVTESPAIAPATGSADTGSADVEPVIDVGSAEPPPTRPGTRPTNPPTRPTRPATGSAATDPPVTPPAPPAAAPDAAVAEADDCDEAGCVLSNYDRPCCTKYKAKGPEIAQRVGGIPETLDRSMVRAGVDGIKPRVIACGEKSGVKGTVKISVVVSPEGAVTGADVQDAPDAGLGSCVAGALRSAKFGKSVEGGSFTYPFVF